MLSSHDRLVSLPGRARSSLRLVMISYKLHVAGEIRRGPGGVKHPRIHAKHAYQKDNHVTALDVMQLWQGKKIV